MELAMNREEMIAMLAFYLFMHAAPSGNGNNPCVIRL